MTYQPPYAITTEILNLVAAISEAIGRLTVHADQARALRLRRINRIRTIYGSLAIEGGQHSERSADHRDSGGQAGDRSNSFTLSPTATAAWGGCGRA